MAMMGSTGAYTNGTRPMVDARDVHKYFHNNEVLRGVNMQVLRGEVVVVIGPSGSGKTTFLRCINHLEKINRGRIYVDGKLIGYRETGDGKLVEDSERNIAGIRAEIGMVFQRFNLFPHLTALQNICLAPVHVHGVPARGEVLAELGGDDAAAADRGVANDPDIHGYLKRPERATGSRQRVRSRDPSSGSGRARAAARSSCPARERDAAALRP